MKEKKRVFLCLGILIAIVSVVGVSYAVWQLTFTQTGTNVVTTGCFQITFTDQNPISLTNAYPITNEEGKTLTPYEFTITNTCDSEASYQVNLEILNDSTFTETSYIRGMLNEKGSTSGSRILTRNKEVEKTLENARLAYKLSNGVLAGNASKTFEFRLWMDNDTPAIESVMEKTLNSKITVITSLKLPVDTTNMMVAMNFDEEFFRNDTYTQGDKYRSTLKKIVFESVKSPIEGAKEVKDFSMNQDESVLGYYVENADQTEVELHIQADGKIKMNPNGSYYFSRSNYSGPTYVFEGFENIDTSNATNMSHMFYGMSNITSLDLTLWDLSNLTDMSYMFEGLSGLTSIDLSSLDTTNVTNMSGMFGGMSSLTSIDLNSLDTSNVTDMSWMFSSMSGLTSIDLSPLDTSNVTNMAGMFCGMSGLTSIDLKPLNTSNVTNMGCMFESMSGLTSIDLSPLDTSNVTNMIGMFSGMSGLTSLDLKPLNTSNVTDMGRMFESMSGLKNIDLSHFDTSKVTNMTGMFNGSRSLTSLDLSSFNTSNVVYMWNMFSDMSDLTNLDLSSFDTSNVTGMFGMFQNNSKLTNITYGENFIHNEGATITSMFQDCPANKPTHSSWNSVTW